MKGSHAERMRRFLDAGLYLVTSGEHSGGRTTPEIVAAGLDAGVRLVQLREKAMPIGAFMDLAMQVRALTDRYGALMIVNDRLDVAMGCGADGVHLGRDDLPVDVARRLAPEMVIGASAHSVPDVEDAALCGASYVNIGPLFPTSTKAWQGRFLGLDGLHGIARAARLPFTVMGGIKLQHVDELIRAGATAVAVVTALTAAADPGAAARELLNAVRRARQKTPPGTGLDSLRDGGE